MEWGSLAAQISGRRRLPWKAVASSFLDTLTAPLTLIGASPHVSSAESMLVTRSSPRSIHSGKSLTHGLGSVYTARPDTVTAHLLLRGSRSAWWCTHWEPRYYDICDVVPISTPSCMSCSDRRL
ncbi:hypothetical protein P154DRAFT_319999 [Amniculicola lignicola CBS 123094]|uniref:Uncharacterized protein n=1 Tax=Amniculicola lignicola CBS 123094 TaxID=1392246 RepID=A0A6A5W6M0_9PLEO|nr:hypothetical protein P154DRAFT_319999 [Amniculicola lignicola CBS 123094]